MRYKLAQNKVLVDIALKTGKLVLNLLSCTIFLKTDAIQYQLLQCWFWNYGNIPGAGETIF